MKKKIVKSLVLIFVLAIVNACSTSNSVTSEFGIQKRKYTKGFFIENNNTFSQTKKNKNELNSQITLSNNNNKITKHQNTNKLKIKGNTKSNNSLNLKNQKINIKKTLFTQQNRFDNKKDISSVTTLNSNKIIKKNRLSLRKNILQKTTQNTLPDTDSEDEDLDITLLYLLAFLLPWLAVGLVTDWDVEDVVINILLTMLCFIPGVIHAFMKVKENRG